MGRKTAAPREDEKLLHAAALENNLRIVEPEHLSLTRQRCGGGFTYVDGKGKRIVDERVAKRIKSLAVPPAYEEVKIARSARAHLQAIGRDEAGRLQYIYHPDWEHVRETQKLERLAILVEALPAIRGRIARLMRKKGMSKEKAIAAVLMLIDRTHIRVGCNDYVHSGRSRGATTLLKRHVRREGKVVKLHFHGKHRREISCQIDSAVFSSVASELLELPGARFFRYRGDEGQYHDVRAGDVNIYLQEMSQAPITAKDFRTLAATAVAALQLGPVEPAASAAARRRQTTSVITHVAALLGNTPAVARRSYVHRCLMDAFERDELRRIFQRAKSGSGLGKGEDMVRLLLARRG